MPILETAGYRRFWPMRQHLGRERLPNGQRIQHEAEVYRDMVTGEIHAAMSGEGEFLGWNGNPPNSASGSKEREGTVRSAHEAYRRHYDLIDWSTSDSAPEGPAQATGDERCA